MAVARFRMSLSEACWVMKGGGMGDVGSSLACFVSEEEEEKLDWRLEDDGLG